MSSACWRCFWLATGWDPLAGRGPPRSGPWERSRSRCSSPRWKRQKDSTWVHIQEITILCLTNVFQAKYQICTGWVLLSFLFFPFPPVFYTLYVLLVKDLESQKRSTEAPRSHRKHCSWNASSELSPPLFPWLCDLILRHTFSNYCPTASLKDWFSTAALFILAVLGQACVSWPIRGHWVFGRRCLKETGAFQTAHVFFEH